MFKKESDNDLKMILVGSSGVGKTNLINSLIDEKFQAITLATSSSTYVVKKIMINDKLYEVEIWDTAGQEKFYSLTKIFIKGAKLVIFVYDVTQRKTFEEIDHWINTVNEVLEEKPVIGLAGNKKDLYLKEEVINEEGNEKAKEIGAIFRLTSAKEGFGISDLFEELMYEYIKKVESGEIKPHKSYNLEKGNTNKKKKCCS